ncbi:MAG: flagellar basal body protein, partial [Rhodospirillales bacterium]|nr:flagellar basal body protein [Rhodospirillales bacterium]
TILSAMKKRLAWLGQRQEILAQNIANADTPGQKAKDLAPLDFKKLVGRENRQIAMRRTNKSHLTGGFKPPRDFDENETKKPYETAPAGNAIILEEQMMKLGKTSADHKLMTELYKKHMAMFKIAIGKA